MPGEVPQPVVGAERGMAISRAFSNSFATVSNGQLMNIVLEYQITDERGNVIGRTHLEAGTEAELRAKLVTAHTEATRALHRAKRKNTVLDLDNKSLRRALQPKVSV
jgi:hypothetical protein